MRKLASRTYQLFPCLRHWGILRRISSLCKQRWTQREIMTKCFKYSFKYLNKKLMHTYVYLHMCFVIWGFLGANNSGMYLHLKHVSFKENVLSAWALGGGSSTSGFSGTAGSSSCKHDFFNMISSHDLSYYI